MASIERTAYPHFRGSPTAQELQELFTPTEDEIAFATRTVRGQDNRVRFLVLVKCFQYLNLFPAATETPSAIVEHIRGCLRVPDPVSPGYEQPRTLYRHQCAIRDYLRITPAQTRQTRHLAARIVLEAAQVMVNPADLINAAVERLRQENCEVPGFPTLNRLVQRIRTLVHRRLFGQVHERLAAEKRQALDELLLTTDLSRRQSRFDDLKRTAKRPTLKHVELLLDHQTWLESLGEVAGSLEGLSPAIITHFVAEAKTLNAGELKDINAPKRYTLVLCLIDRMRVRCRDDLSEMFLRRMGSLHKRAKEKLKEIQAQQRQMAEHLVDSLGDVLEVAADDLTDAETGRRVRSVLASRGGVERLQDDCAAVTAWSGDNYLPLLWQLYRRHRHSLYRLVRGLRLAPTSQDRSLLDALAVVLASENRRADWIEAENLDLSFASERWRKLVIKQHGQRTRLNRRQLEICVFSCLASELKSCDVSVEGSEAYADYRKQLLPWAECEPLIADYCQKLELPDTASGFVDTLRRELEEAVDQGFPDNQEVHINTQGEPTLRRVTARDIPPSAQVLEAAIHERMPVRNVLDVLCNVEHWTHWTRHFGPLSGSDPKLDNAVERYILTAFALGTNLGVYQGARHMPDLVTAQMLSFVNRRHSTVEKLDMARQDIIDQYSRLGLPRYWGQGKSAAVDGTLYELYEQNLLANYHFRYQKKGAIAFHVVSDMYIALFSHFIPPGVWEAIYIIEALLSNKSSIQPDTVYADTQGQSATVFAFTHLLGIKLMPRIRNWKDLTFFRPHKDVRYTHIDSLFKNAIDWKLIERHWQDLMQVVLSIQAGTVSSATLLRKLGNYSRKNRLYQAAREVGRAVRTIFLLNWISDYSLRRKVTDGTNKVEAYHGFSKWVSFGGEGIIGANDPDEQQKRIRYNDLVATAIIFQNIVDMTQAVEDLESDGFAVNRDDLAYLSPYITRSLKRFGDYFMHFDHAPDPLEDIIRSRWVAPVKDEVAASSCA